MIGYVMQKLLEKKYKSIYFIKF